MEKSERWSWVLISTTVLCLGVLIGEQRALDQYDAPPVCEEAFDLAEETFGIGSGTMNATYEVLPDLARYDEQSLLDLREILEDAQSKTGVIQRQYADARDECLRMEDPDERERTALRPGVQVR